MPKRYVFDANTIVSSVLLLSSVPRRALDKALAQGRLLLSSQIVAELDDVMGRPKLDRYVSESARLSFLVALVHAAELAEPLESVTECRDPKDDKYLALAVSGSATGIVSGDADLLDMNPFRGIPIVNARAFLDSEL